MSVAAELTAEKVVETITALAVPVSAGKIAAALRLIGNGWVNRSAVNAVLFKHPGLFEHAGADGTTPLWTTVKSKTPPPTVSLGDSVRVWFKPGTAGDVIEALVASLAGRGELTFADTAEGKAAAAVLARRTSGASGAADG